MYKSRLKRKKLWFDITPMCDIAIVMLIFSAFTWVPKRWVPIKIQEPEISIRPVYEKKPSWNTEYIFMGQGKVMLKIPDEELRKQTLLLIGKEYNIDFTPAEVLKFSKIEIVGVAVSGLKKFIDSYPNQKAFLAEPGIPDDASHNELFEWIYRSRVACKTLYDNDVLIAIDADKKVMYPDIEKTVATLEKQHIFRFSLITTKNYFDNEPYELVSKRQNVIY